jgi:hypothetical protein
MKITTIQSFGASLLALGLAAACTVTSTTEGKDGGDHGTGATSGDDSGSGGKGTGGSGATGGTHTGGSGNGGAGKAGAGTGGEATDAGTPDGSAGAAGSAGSGGTTGDSGPGVDAGPIVGGSDPCDTAEATANDDRDHATPYTLGTEFNGCLQKDTDVDFYSYTVPSTPAQGGYVVMSITQVGTEGGVSATSQAVADNGDIINSYGTGGQSVFHWFNVKAGAKFRIYVKYFNGGGTPTPYTLKLAYKGVPDDNEPNDLRAKATPIMNGKAVNGYLFAGYENSTGIVDSAWEDWYKVTLPAGTASVNLTDLASDVNGEITLYDADGAEVAGKYSPTNGASVILSQAVTAGDYYVKVTPFGRPTVEGGGSTVPAYVSQPYTLTVKVP